jgi:hypothetical protein
MDFGTELTFLFAIINVYWLFVYNEEFDTKDELIQKLHKLSKLYWEAPTYSPSGVNPSEKVLEQMESLLMNYLKKRPQDTEM